MNTSCPPGLFHSRTFSTESFLEPTEDWWVRKPPFFTYYATTSCSVVRVTVPEERGCAQEATPEFLQVSAT